MRPGSEKALELFKSGSEKEFRSSLNIYSACVHAVATKKKRPELEQLNNFWQNEVPSLQCLTLKQLSDITRFKLTRGKMRPLQKIVDSNNNSKVVDCTSRAFALLKAGSWIKGLELLVDELNGIGVATASCIAAPIRPDLCPFMSDEVIESVTDGGPRLYTMECYKRVQKALTDKADWLNVRCDEKDWNAEMVGCSLWSAANASVFSLSVGAVESCRSGPVVPGRAENGKSCSSSGFSAGNKNTEDSEAPSKKKQKLIK